MKSTTIAIALMLCGCAVAGVESTSSTQDGQSFEQFMAHTYREPWPGGHFIVDGDMPIHDEKQLYEFWEGLQQGGLIINRVGNNDDRWDDNRKLDLTYCISNSFGANKSAVVAAMAAATDQGWEVRANVNFTYVPSEDANCTADNTNIWFDVRQVTGQSYLARSFFPSSGRPSREVLVDTSSFGNVGWPLSHILGHELGHTLGFRHEHTRPEAGTCFEDDNWRALTPYDSASIMHYPQCNGTSQDLNWTDKDAQGAAAVYGAPSGGTPPPPPPPPPNNTDTQTGSLILGQIQNFTPYTVNPGTTFAVTMSGTGDPDLYVQWGAAPTTTSYNCRPYIDGPNEQCSLTVPAGTSSAYVMVNGYAAATYTLHISWTSP